MTSLTDVLYRNQQTHKEFVLQICKEQLMTVNIVMYFPKNSFLRDAFNEQLSDLIENGIVQYWVQKYADQRFLNVKAASSTQQKLTIEKLSGVFNIWLIGLAIGILAFLFETAVGKIKKSFALKDSVKPPPSPKALKKLASKLLKEKRSERKMQLIRKCDQGWVTET